MKSIKTNFFKGLLFFSLGTVSLFANAHGGHGGPHHGGGHYGGGYYHGGGHYGGGYYGRGGYYGGGFYGGGWGPGVVIEAPYGTYYTPECQTIRVCNNYGHCWLQESCF